MLESIKAVKESLGYRLQGTYNCKALNLGRYIVQRQISAEKYPTIDTRAAFDDEQSGILKTQDWKDANGLDGFDPQAELYSVCYLLSEVGLQHPTLESSLDYFKSNTDDTTSEKDFKEIVGEYRDDYKSDKEAKDAVREMLQEEAKLRCDMWNDIGGEALRVVKTNMDLASDGVLIDKEGNEVAIKLPTFQDCWETCERHINGTKKKEGIIARLRRTQGIRKSLGERRMLKAVLAHQNW
jgi:hypothetical protein